MEHVVGIDLGTTYSAVAVVGASGRPEILVNRDGERFTASVVYFGEDGVLVGTEAQRSAERAPLDVVQFVKREMGNPEWRFVSSDDQSYTPEEVSALILKRLKQDAEAVLGKPVRDAVITVPAYFDDARRRATRDAGTIAGLNVVRVLNEPTAAALAFGVDLGGRGTVMVYDLGGGTFDVTVLRISDGVFDVLGTDGLHELGGFEWDNRLMQFLNDEYMAQGGSDLTDTFETEADLRRQAEGAKRALSSARSTRVILSHESVIRTVTVTREKFEDLTSDLLNQSRDLTDSLVEELGLTYADIDNILLVGGSTRMPMVTKMLEELSGKLPLRAGNPDELVALGAAVQARLLTPSDYSESAESQWQIVVLDVTSQALGTVALDDNHYPKNNIIIPRNTKVPAKVSEVFGTMVDGQTGVRVTVTQGDDEDIGHVKFLTKGKWPNGGQLFAIPPYPVDSPILITFHYDVDQLVQVQITDLTADASLGTFEIENVANLTTVEVRAARQKNEELEVN